MLQDVTETVFESSTKKKNEKDVNTLGFSNIILSELAELAERARGFLQLSSGVYSRSPAGHSCSILQF